MKALVNAWIARLPALLRRLGPYAAIELLLPGGSVIALLIWLSRHRASLGVPPSSARGIPPHLSLPPFDGAVLIYSTHTNQHVVSRS
jgi:hypothetical protein